MANERNVAALYRELEACGVWGAILIPLSQALAARGVLVPQAMTDQEIDKMLGAGVHIYGDEDDGYHYDYEAPPLILALERIAKGET